MGQQVLKQDGIDRPARGVQAIAVEGLAAPGGQAHHRIQGHVGRPGVEAKDPGGIVRCREQGQVGDAAKVEQRAGTAGTRIQQGIDKRDQGRAASAGGDVARTEIRDDGDAGALGNDGGAGQLQGGVGAKPGQPAVRHVADRGLSV